MKLKIRVRRGARWWLKNSLIFPACGLSARRCDMNHESSSKKQLFLASGVHNRTRVAGLVIFKFIYFNPFTTGPGLRG